MSVSANNTPIGNKNMSVSIVTAIKRFLEANTHPDLAALYNPAMECQITVQKLDGERIDQEYKGRTFHAYSNGIQTWKPIRIPYNANTNPEYDIEKPLTYDLGAYAEGIGMTGWDWINKCSRWIMYDFDALAGHSDKHTKRLTDDQLSEIQRILAATPWVSIRKSTSGRGLHLYIYLDPPVPTSNHCEHAALAKAILHKLSLECNHDFASQSDGSGGSNAWVWHIKMHGTDGDGLSLVKPSVPLHSIPNNWREFLPVVLGKKNRIDVPSSGVDELSSECMRVKLDKEHYKLIEYLNQSRFISYFDSERWMIVTHSYAIKEAYEELNLKGIYNTISPGNDPSSPNSFAFPLANGSWVIRRFTPKIMEADTWEEDSKGFLRCYINRKPTLDIAAKANQGILHKDGGYIFASTNDMISCLKVLGINIDADKLPNDQRVCKLNIKANSTGPGLSNVIAEMDILPNDKPMSGWYQEKRKWYRNFSNFNQDQDVNSGNDSSIRHLISLDKTDAGWVIKTDNNEWNQEPYIHVRLFLKNALKCKHNQLDSLLGTQISQPWVLTNEPFKPEYLEGRRWNRNACQLRFVPSIDKDIINLEYPSWISILNHCGKSLDVILSTNEWARTNGIVTGADYLKAWIASSFQKPYEPLPYLFFYGPENSGKSIFHEALSLLITKGYIKADQTLKSTGGFNGELEGSIFAVIEETNLRSDKIANQRVKAWVTSIDLPIHRKHTTPYNVTNTTHWLQCANDANHCPVFTGDTRITMIEVNHLEKEVPKNILLKQLETEAPDFLASILNIKLPEITGRLAIPVINTPDKHTIETANRNAAEEYLEEYTYYQPGASISYADLFTHFKKTLDGQEAAAWSIRKFGSFLPSRYPKGRLHGANPNWFIGNISLTEPTSMPDKPTPRLVLVGQYLEPEQVPEHTNGKVIQP